MARFNGRAGRSTAEKRRFAARVGRCIGSLEEYTGVDDEDAPTQPHRVKRQSGKVKRAQ
jgi:hypothetical protein